MAPASNESQFKFLISCIRYSNNGKVDFGEVARECDIVTKGAAAKRYERMMKAHGIAPNAATVKQPRSNIPKAERINSTATNATKKRKTDAFADDTGAEDDVEDYGPDLFKADPEQLNVKEEAAQQAFEALDMASYTPAMDIGNSDIGFGDHFQGAENFNLSDPFNTVGGYSTPANSTFDGGDSRSYMVFGGYVGSGDVQPGTPISQPADYQPIVISD